MYMWTMHKKDYEAMEEEEVEEWDLTARQTWSLDDPVTSIALVRMARSSPAKISLLLTNLHLDKAIKSLPKCN